MNWLSENRLKLLVALRVEVFTEDLQDRVQGYPPIAGRVAAPAVWIGEHLGNIADGQGTVTYSVVGIVDGELEASYAMRDHMLSAAISACHRVPGLRPVRWRNEMVTIPDTNPAERYRGFVLEVNATAITRTFTVPPVADPATVPPTEYAEV